MQKGLQLSVAVGTEIRRSVELIILGISIQDAM
jgi:hypothetical protein